ncbi:MAG: carboxypeptidase-like regulatory domain-containing protein, partial [Acidobacteriota bacterium]
RAGALSIPLTLAGLETAVVEVVSVSARSLPAGRSVQELELPRLSARVLNHSWQVLLPEGARYRVRGSTLGIDGSRPLGETATKAEDLSEGTHLTGVVRTQEGDALPGATVTLSANGQRKSVVTSATGRYVLSRIPTGAVSVKAELEGFMTTESQPRIRANRVNALNLMLPLAAMSETIVVTAELPSVVASSEVSGSLLDDINEFFEFQDLDGMTEDFRRRISRLSQGLTDGVKPLPVTIPETGKAIHLAGFLPPRGVSITLDVKEPRN